ncbi:hypothetical protein LPU83_pLPU83c_0681 (plasmid) [Rhizobium favelukesii]|uniref:HTH luxR-type domain-containing protein n=1 Tax=Rhizobium favelukesii TaxID=348824 RepID=W6RQV5_9HYPH|nr:hypothetical protein LPU83_pLPU83c_0681 [Rhizobium favelukesii]
MGLGYRCNALAVCIAGSNGFPAGLAAIDDDSLWSDKDAAFVAISTGTVKVHRRNVYRKLGISSQTQLLAIYLRNLS